MTEHEFLTQLSAQLKKDRVADADDITNEYAQHFAYKRADGYSEDEIAAKLGDPAALSAQFAQSGAKGEPHAAAPLVTAGLCLAGVFAGLFFLLLAAWGLVMAAGSLVCAAAAVCLLAGQTAGGLIPTMPYWCGAIFALTLAALAVLIAAGCGYYCSFMHQLARSYLRFSHNVRAAAAGQPQLPSLSIRPQLPAKVNRRLRSAALVSLALFAACFVLTYLVCCLSAGSWEFWHVWGWFGYAV